MLMRGVQRDVRQDGRVQGQNTSAWWVAVKQAIPFRDAQLSNAGVVLTLLTGTDQ